ncbi:MAG: ABC transporter substrate-binding protein [Nitrospirae bacterium]|nr:ABC transporter substrate-binding protein [Nitrospirota bacterium]MBI3594746.1 ABC transporter substrate-binding protein [Nitrospirota bacterium]
MKIRFVAFVTLAVLVTCSFLGLKGLKAEEISVLLSQDISIYRDALEGIKKIRPGEIKIYHLKGDPNETKRVMSQVRRHPGDLVISIGLLASQVARENIKSTPLLFCMVYYPERYSFFNQNTTGIRLEFSPTENFSEIKRIFPEVKKIGVLYDPKKTGKVIIESREAARNMGLSLIEMRLGTEKDLPAGLNALQGNVDLLWLIPDSTVVSPQSIDKILLASFKFNMPVMTFSDEFVVKGAVASLTPDFEATGEEIGRLAEKIILGELPSRFPIRSVSKKRLSLNLKMARKMGIEIAPEAIQKADKVYE